MGDASKSFRWTVFGVALLLLVSLVATHTGKLSREVAQLEQQLGAEKSRQMYLSVIRHHYEEYRRLKEELERQLTVTAELARSRTSPVSAMAALEHDLGKATGVRVQSLEFRGKSVIIRGEASSQDDATGYQASLERAGFTCSELSAPNDGPGEKGTGLRWNLNCVFPEREQASSGRVGRIGGPRQKAMRIRGHG